jgi:N-ethylmaleimide reductase
MSLTNLFTPLNLGSLALPNRIFMAPLTRCRASEGHIPNDLNAEYYSQRAAAGLIISEATSVSPCGYGYPNTPGIHTKEQVGGWKKVTEAVHAKGGHIYLQLWHVGRISHPAYQQDGVKPVAPSAIKPKGQVFTGSTMEEYVTPRALETDEIAGIISEYVHGAALAKEAGFDGVEIHNANGYLLDQFLRSGSNHRDDAYGGSIENRARLLLEVMQAVCAEIGGARVALRLSPVTPANDASDPQPQPLFGHVVRQLAALGLAYVHVIEGSTGAERDYQQGDTPFDYGALRQTYRTAGGHAAWMVNNAYDLALAQQALDGGADLVAFGKPFIANPDLTRRLREGAALNPADRSTFYGGGSHGYTDYPTLGD